MRLTLRRLAPSSVASFGVPFIAGVVTRTGQIRLGTLALRVTPTLWWYDATGTPTSIKAVRVQVPMQADLLVDDLTTDGTGPDWPLADTPFSEVSHPVTHTVQVADYTIEKSAAGVYSIPPSNVRDVTLFASREPCVVAAFPEGYLASTGVFGPLLSRQAVVSDPALAGVRYLSDAFIPAVTSALYLDTYPANAASVTLPMPVEGFLYDRAATILLALAHSDDDKFRLPAYRYAWSYLSGIVLDGDATGYTHRGYWTGKGSWDSKYSHARGIYYYLALTGDEGALAALKAIGDLWMGDLFFSVPYQNGKIRNWDKLWTERLLGTALEGTIYGFLATGERRYLDAFGKLLHTAYRHISTQDQAELDGIMQPWTETLADGLKITHRFPPQNAWVHNGSQSADAGPRDPWCSGWMIELVLDPLLAYQTMTNDPRVDDIFVRLGRFLRDTGTCYMSATGLDRDYFLAPKTAYDQALPASRRRRVIPMYGSGRKMDGSRWDNAEYSDYEHVPDATGMTAAAWRGLVRQQVVGGPIGPFLSEMACADALHQEYSASAVQSLLVRDAWIYRDPTLPAGTFHSQGRIALSTGGDPTKFAAYVTQYGIGYPRWAISPERKLSWWFNSSILQYGLLKQAQLAVPVARQGFVPVGTVPPPPPPPPQINHAPVADAGGPYEVVAGVDLTLRGSGTDIDGDVLTYRWSFADQQEVAGAVAVRSWPTPGVYAATFTVTDAKGLSASASVPVTVLAPPPTYAELVAQVASLTAQVAWLQADHEVDAQTIVALSAEVARVTAKIAAARAALED